MTDVPPRDPPVLLGQSAVVVGLRLAITMAARTHATVLILGETGVGKEVVARLIHTQSPRAAHPFVAVNSSGIPDTLLESELFGHTRGSFTDAHRDKVGLLQQAERGTVFLDEVGEMTLRMQAALLRFTETGEIQRLGADTRDTRVDVRLITATNRDLRAQIVAGAFREDLYYRLNVIQIHVPPLRERGADILLLLDYYLERAAQLHGLPAPTFTPEAVQWLLGYAWPGNVRELRNLTERVVAQGRASPLTPADLPSGILGGSGMSRRTRLGGARGTEAPAAGTLDVTTAERVQRLWDRMEAGEDFWSVVHQPFKARDLTRDDLVALIDRGLRETSGSYRALLSIFHLAPRDYKRFHAFIYQQECNLPVAPYRNVRPTSSPRERSATPQEDPGPRRDPNEQT